MDYTPPERILIEVLLAEKSVKLSKEQIDMKSFLLELASLVYTMKQKLLILVNANWPTLPLKVNDLKASFPEIGSFDRCSGNQLRDRFFKDYGGQKRIDDDWIDVNIVPYDVVFHLAKSQWRKVKYWDFRLLDRSSGYHDYSRRERNLGDQRNLKNM